jgi:aryl-alcohol dehydrogenase-like predicted oxidoreductase
MKQELDDSRKRLQTDYFDLYQVHWPDPDTPIAKTAEIMNEFHKEGIIKAVGVSNYSIEQMKEFMKYSPLHCLQPQYSMFCRDIEEEVVPFCLKNNIAIISYAPLYSGLLTGKFFLDGKKVPKDTNRKMKSKEFEEPRTSINKQTLSALKEIADSYNKTLAQLAINWNYDQAGITSSIVGTRNLSQLSDNLGGVDFQITDSDMKKIDEILKKRLEQIDST